MMLEVHCGPIVHERGSYPLWFDRQLGPEAEAVIRQVLAAWGYSHPDSDVVTIRVSEAGYSVLGPNEVR